MVSPLPKAPTGIADYTVDVVRALDEAHEIELFHDQDNVSDSLPAPAFRLADFPARVALGGPFGAIVYQMGNAPAHDFMYDWMRRLPGIVVLHDLVLHHSYARRHLDSPESRAYAEDPSSEAKRRAAEETHRQYLTAIETVHPGEGERLMDAHFNTSGDLLPFAFPLFEPAIQGALAVGVHNDFMADAVRAARPGLPCVRLAMPITARATSFETAKALRARLGFADDHLIVGCFGLLTREKRVETLARAFARVAEIQPAVRLLLAGPVADAVWLDNILARTGIAARTVVTGRLESEDFLAAMDIADVVAQLRYPTARETSAALLRVMAQGRPVIVSDLANQSEVPMDAVRRVDPCDEEGDLARAIDGALRNPEAARAMGERAALHVLKENSDQRTRESYDQLLNSVAPHYSQPHS